MLWLRKTGLIVALALSASVVAPGRAPGQDVLPVAAGAGAGLAAGGYVTLGVAVLRARQGHYINSVSDILGVQSAPLLAGTAGGAILGAVDEDRLWTTVLGGAAGAAFGTGVGILIGDAVWDDPGRRWAGGVIGGAAGVLVGSALGLVLGGEDEDEDFDDADDRTRPGVPIAVRIRF